MVKRIALYFFGILLVGIWGFGFFKESIGVIMNSEKETVTVHISGPIKEHTLNEYR